MIVEQYPLVRFPSKYSPLYYAVVGDMDGMHAHFENAENIDQQFNEDKR